MVGHPRLTEFDRTYRSIRHWNPAELPSPVVDEPAELDPADRWLTFGHESLRSLGQHPLRDKSEDWSAVAFHRLLRDAHRTSDHGRPPNPTSGYRVLRSRNPARAGRRGTLTCFVRDSVWLLRRVRSSRSRCSRFPGSHGGTASSVLWVRWRFRVRTSCSRAKGSGAVNPNRT